MYPRRVARPEMLYQGQLVIDGAEAVFAEVWHAETTAVVYLPDASTLIMQNAATGLTPNGRLTITGTVNDQDAEWTAWVPEQTTGSYRDAEVILTDGTAVTGLVTMTNHKVIVTGDGQHLELAGAKVRQVGGRSAVIENPGGENLTMTLAKPGCGCGGPRR